MRRHIDPTDESSNFAPPPVRKRAPREVATVVGKPSVDPKTLQPYEADPNEATPYLANQSMDSVPTSETDVANLEATNISRGLEDGVLAINLDHDEDTWEVEAPEDLGPIRYRPLLGGLVLGMILAVGLGQYVIEPMISGEVVSAPSAPPPTAPVEAAEAVPDDAADVVPEAVAEPVDTGVADAPLPSAETEPEPEAEGDVATPEVAEVQVAAPAPPVRVNKPTTAKPSKPAASGDEPTEFTVTFRSADPSILRMVVTCHKGGTVDGASVVHIVRAGKGPCKVVGYRGEVKESVSAVLMGPKNYTCFKDGARRCD